MTINWIEMNPTQFHPESDITPLDSRREELESTFKLNNIDSMINGPQIVWEDHILVSKQIDQITGLLVARGNNCISIRYREPILDSQMKPKAWQEIEFLLLWVTTESNMADKHEIQGNAPRAHQRQEVEFSPW